MTKENAAVDLANLFDQKVERPKQGPVRREAFFLVQVGSLSFVPREGSYFLSSETSKPSTDEKSTAASDASEK
jgi:predicted ATPase